MEGAGLETEEPAELPADEGAYEGSARYIQWVVDTDIDLGIRYEEGPDEDEAPPGTCMF